ncbi:hypothetical protein GCM10025870_11790 [Agromyces marinus]|uniref:Uncharacterized protein n=1 Tax=Agromyces marinus TaxID=1389020 RepID=A0ABM8H031_9MICO|nr:hypothetical protein [Agromyces marinus]BDZ54106.1 hypothetical protein GCM10025870_11790 [Agromyces marinus]
MARVEFGSIEGEVGEHGAVAVTVAFEDVPPDQRGLADPSGPVERHRPGSRPGAAHEPVDQVELRATPDEVLLGDAAQRREHVREVEGAAHGRLGRKLDRAAQRRQPLPGAQHAAQFVRCQRLQVEPAFEQAARHPVGEVVRAGRDGVAGDEGGTRSVRTEAEDRRATHRRPQSPAAARARPDDIAVLAEELRDPIIRCVRGPSVAEDGPGREVVQEDHAFPQSLAGGVVRGIGVRRRGLRGDRGQPRAHLVGRDPRPLGLAATHDAPP